MGADDEFDEVRKMINRMLADAVQGKSPEPATSSEGFAGRVQPSDDEPRPVRRYILQVPPDPILPGPEVNAAEGSLFVTLDLAGTTPTAVSAKLAGRLLFIDVAGPKPLQRIVELPDDVEPDVRWTVRDGVLDLTLRRRARAKPP